MKIHRLSLMLSVLTVAFVVFASFWPATLSAQDDPARDLAKECLVVLHVGDVPGLIDDLASVLSQVSPGMDSGQLKAQFGGEFGDPELQGLPPGSGIAFTIYGEDLFCAYMEVTAEKIEAYRQAVTQDGDKAAVAEGLLLVSETDEGLAKGTAAAALVKQLFSGSGAPALKATASTSQVLPLLEPQVSEAMSGYRQMLETMPGAAPENAGAMADVMEIELRSLVAMARQMDAPQATLRFENDDIRIALDLDPLDGSELGKLAAAPSPPVDPLLALIGGDGAYKGGFSCDSEALGSLIKAIGEDVRGNMELPQDKYDAFMAMYLDWLEAIQSTFAFRYVIPGEGFLSGSAAMLTTDDTKATEYVLGMEDLFEKSGMNDFYQKMGMGMAMDIQPEVRMKGDVPVHVMKLDVQETGETSEMMPMSNLLKDMRYEIAITGGHMLLASSASELDSLIETVASDATPESSPLMSQQTFPPGGKAYVDFDLGALVTAMQEAMATDPNDPQAQAMMMMGGMFVGVPPITMAGYWGPGEEMSVQVNLPSGFFQRIAGGIMMMGAMSTSQTTVGEDPMSP